MLHTILKALWHYRYFVFTAVRSDFRNRVARSRLGFLWLIIAPLSQVLIYAFVLSALMSQRLPGIDNPYSYAIYLLAGFQAWFLFVEIMTRSVTVFIENGNVLKKISFPRAALPVIVVLTALINNVIFLGLVLFIYYIIGFSVSPTLLWLPILIMINVMFSAGIGLVAGILNVFIRDIGQLVAIGLQFLFWLTPIVYTINIIPESAQFVLKLNPIFWITESYHRVMVYGEGPDFAALSVVSILSLVLLMTAFWMFRKASPEIVDVL